MVLVNSLYLAFLFAKYDNLLKTTIILTMGKYYSYECVTYYFSKNYRNNKLI